MQSNKNISSTNIHDNTFTVKLEDLDSTFDHYQQADNETKIKIFEEISEKKKALAQITYKIRFMQLCEFIKFIFWSIFSFQTLFGVTLIINLLASCCIIYSFGPSVNNVFQ